MATAAADIQRSYESGADPVFNDLPAVASDIIYEGSAVGDNASGAARPLVAADPFMGFAYKRCDNSGGAAGAKNVRVRSKGIVQLAVTGVTGVGDHGETVYASEDTTFTLTSTSNTAIGKVHRWISSTSCMVAFEGVSLRSL